MIVAVLLVVLLVVVGGGVLLVRIMRANADPRRRLSAGGDRSIDPFTLGEPWRFFVRDAVSARRRFEDAVGRARPGPLRDRLDEIGAQLSEGVDRTWATAQQGQTLSEARKRIDTNKVGQRIAQLEGASDLNTEGTLVSLRAQLSSAERLDRVTAEAESKLRLLQAQLDEAVARAAELSVKAGDVGELAGVGDDIAHVVDEMEALRLALEETSGGGSTATS